MGLYELYDHTQIQADKQYTVYGIVYENISKVPRANHPTLYGFTVRGNAVAYQVGQSYSAKGGVIFAAGREPYSAGFHRFLSLDDVRQFHDFNGQPNLDTVPCSAVIAEFTVFGKDIITQGYYKQHEPRLLTTVWSKVTYVGCFDVRSRTCQKLSIVPVASLDTPQPMELVEAAKGPKDYAFADELAYLAIGEDI